MDSRKEKGDKAEEMAVLFLKRIGFQIIALNWRYKRLEIDIIGYDGDILVFVEVKLRSSTSYGTVADVVNSTKQDRLFRAAHAFLRESGHQGEIRFDILAFMGNKLEYIKDAFWKY